jgi:hypothetical protein
MFQFPDTFCCFLFFFFFSPCDQRWIPGLEATDDAKPSSGFDFSSFLAGMGGFPSDTSTKPAPSTTSVTTTNASNAASTSLSSLSVSSVFGVGFPPRYGGSDQLFIYIKHSLKRVARVNTTVVFLDIVQVYALAPIDFLLFLFLFLNILLRM